MDKKVSTRIWGSKISVTSTTRRPSWDAHIFDVQLFRMPAAFLILNIASIVFQYRVLGRLSGDDLGRLSGDDIKLSDGRMMGFSFIRM